VRVAFSFSSALFDNQASYVPGFGCFTL